MTAPSHPGEPLAFDRQAAGRPLLRNAAAPGPDGLVCATDPADAGWDWTTFHACRLTPGQRVGRAADEMERLGLVAEGRVTAPTVPGTSRWTRTGRGS